jgi:hypothetical protein
MQDWVVRFLRWEQILDAVICLGAMAVSWDHEKPSTADDNRSQSRMTLPEQAFRMTE